MISYDTLSRIKDEAERAEYGQTAGIYSRWSRTLGVSVASIRREVRAAFGRSRNYARSSNADTEALARLVASAKQQILNNADSCPSTARILDMLIEQGSVDPSTWGGRLPVTSTIDTHIRRILGGRKQAVTPCVRMETDTPNAVWHIDASVSKVLVAGPESGTVVVKTNHARYKRPRNERVWITGVVDACSRLISLRYHLIEGESAACYIIHLRELFSPVKDPRYPFGGVPGKIVTDNGAFASSEIGKSFCAGAGITLDTILPGNKRANGKIERQWRQLWTEEAVWSLEEGAVWTLEEANERLLSYCIAQAQRPHPMRTTRTRFEAWASTVEVVSASGDWATVPVQRKVGNDLTISINKVRYVLPARMQGCLVTVLLGIDGQAVGWEDPATGIMQELTAYSPVPYGTYRALPKGEAGEIERRAKAGVLTPVGAMARDEQKELSAPEKPARERTVSADYPSVEAAYLDLSERIARECGAPLPASLRDGYMSMLSKHLSRKFVEKTASDLISKIRGV